MQSSANPATVDALEGMLTREVGCGMGSIVFLVDAKEDVSKFEEWEAPKVVTPTADAPKAGGKRKGGAKGGRGKKGKR